MSRLVEPRRVLVPQPLDLAQQPRLVPLQPLPVLLDPFLLLLQSGDADLCGRNRVGALHVVQNPTIGTADVCTGDQRSQGAWNGICEVRNDRGWSYKTAVSPRLERFLHEQVHLLLHVLLRGRRLLPLRRLRGERRRRCEAALERLALRLDGCLGGRREGSASFSRALESSFIQEGASGRGAQRIGL